MSETVLICILSSTFAATVVTSIKELVLWRLNRKAKVADDAKEDREKQVDDNFEKYNELIEGLKKDITKILDTHSNDVQKITSSIESLQKKLNLSLENDKIILKDKIRYLVLKYVEIGEITLDEKHAIQHMWNIYHYDLLGNGDLDDVMSMLDEITVISHH